MSHTALKTFSTHYQIHRLVNMISLPFEEGRRCLILDISGFLSATNNTGDCLSFGMLDIRLKDQGYATSIIPWYPWDIQGRRRTGISCPKIVVTTNALPDMRSEGNRLCRNLLQDNLYSLLKHENAGFNAEDPRCEVESCRLVLWTHEQLKKVAKKASEHIWADVVFRFSNP